MDITRVLHALRAGRDRFSSRGFSFESRNRERPSLSLPASRGHHSGSTCRGFSSPFESRNRERPSLSLPASRGHHSGSTCRGFSSPFESRNRERPSLSLPASRDITRVLHAGDSRPPLRAENSREPEFVVTRLAWTSLGFYMQGIL